MKKIFSEARTFVSIYSCLEGQSWKETFIRMHKEYGQYISCYRDIRGIWNRLKKFLELHCPSILRSLQGGYKLVYIIRGLVKEEY